MSQTQFPEEQLEIALLKVMGCAEVPLTQGWSCQWLIQPSFAPPSCLYLWVEAREAWLQLVILGDRHDDLFEIIYKPDPVKLSRPNFGAKRHCWEEILILSPTQLLDLQRQIAIFEPLKLPTIRLGGRDGIAIRCLWQEQERTHIFRMLAPNLQPSQPQFQLFQGFIELAVKGFSSEPFQSYLQEFYRLP